VQVAEGEQPQRQPPMPSPSSRMTSVAGRTSRMASTAAASSGALVTQSMEAFWIGTWQPTSSVKRSSERRPHPGAGLAEADGLVGHERGQHPGYGNQGDQGVGVGGEGNQRDKDQRRDESLGIEGA
jgi:hypothetical protein